MTKEKDPLNPKPEQGTVEIDLMERTEVYHLQRGELIFEMQSLEIRGKPHGFAVRAFTKAEAEKKDGKPFLLINNLTAEGVDTLADSLSALAALALDLRAQSPFLAGIFPGPAAPPPPLEGATPVQSSSVPDVVPVAFFQLGGESAPVVNE